MSRNVDRFLYGDFAWDSEIYVASAAGLILPISAQADLIMGQIPSASRQFAGPTQFPPTDFAAYGILAFPAVASIEREQARHVNFCNAYLSVLQHTSKVPLPRGQQMVTVWPIESDRTAKRLNLLSRELVCIEAISAYGLTISQQAILQAKNAGVDVSGRGPFLIAWAPPQTKGLKDAIVLHLDLSAFEAQENVTDMIRYWSERIVQNRDLWLSGWDAELTRIEIRNWADRFGSNILAVANGIK